jgi:HPt (histidine-containing phosphotransfer) domain-containing protein
MLDLERLAVLRGLEAATGLPTLLPAIESFASSSRLGDLRRFVAAHAWSQVRSVSHSLKGSAATLGAPRLAALAERLEQAARTADEGAVRELAAELAREFEPTVAALRRYAATASQAGASPPVDGVR